jgi:PAS domain S-box-containing protein
VDWLSPRLLKGRLSRYSIAVALFLISFGMTKLLNLWLFPDRGFVFFLPATVFAAFIGGLFPAILTAVLSAGAAWYFFIPPVNSFDVGLQGLVGLGTFVFAAALSVGVIHRLRAALSKVQRAETFIAGDLAGMTSLNQLSNQLVREGAELKACLNSIVDTAIAIASADKGAVQLVGPRLGTLKIVTHRGFQGSFLKFFEHVQSDFAASAAVAMRTGTQVVVEDVITSEIFAGHESKTALINEDIRAVIATPLKSSKGNVLGMVTTHFRKPHRPAERELRLLDLLARQAADYVERKRAEEIERTLLQDLAKAEEQLKARESELSRVQEIGGVAGFRIPLTPSLVSRRSPEYLRLHGLSAADAVESHSDWLRRVHPGDRERADQTLRTALFDSNAPHYESEYRIVRPSDGQVRWIYARAHIERDADGKATSFIGAHIDITERKKSEKRQQVLMAELDHRVKNILTVVQSFAHQSFQDRQDSAVQLFIGRLTALSQTHTLLAESRWEGARLDQLLQNVVEPYQGIHKARLSHAGPTMQIGPKAAQSLALAFHELVTNASKYGALSSNKGTVSVRWTLGEGSGYEKNLSLVWRESDGPLIETEPKRRGFGSKLLELTALDLGGSVAVHFRPSGVEAKFRFPISRLTDDLSGLAS